jgi:transcriptional regulator with XRE-family HTH domain
VQILGQQVRFARQDRNWTAAELAARAGVSARTVAAIEAGSASVSIGNAIKVATMSGVPLFETTDPIELLKIRRRGEEKLALLPSRVHHPRKGDDDFDF